MFMSNWPMTAKIIARRPRAPTSATDVARLPKKLMRKTVIWPCRQKKTAFAAWFLMKPIIAARSSAFSGAFKSITPAAYLRSIQYWSRNAIELTRTATPAFRKRNAQPTSTINRASAPVKIDRLNPRNVGAQSRHHAQDPERKLNQQSEQDGSDQDRRIKGGRPVSREHPVEDWCDDKDRQDAEPAPKMLRRGDELSETIAVLPDAAPDGNETDADAHIGEDVDRALHRVGDGEVGVFVLVEAADEQNAAGKTDQLHQHLNGSEVADDSGALERTPNHRRRRFIQKRP